ncbi:aKG-HExxH-type peptide beta-hydroxylase [Xanthomonas cannabis]|uniref:aKG-HExxH-type peptide beta-hydroxylase n=1 Tax=Xanthomonas cannabis TaxID=1885674 RepID=UPI000575B1A8|nr:HEXXH motif-containing putative peptide modification protein [Xanthomonas cannabis]KHL57624.1 hypothetical protein OZ13_06280 [Xanthomonas cannabis pv. cannabis]
MDELGLLAEDFACATHSSAPDIIGVLAATRLAASRVRLSARLRGAGQEKLAEALEALDLPETATWRPEIGLVESAGEQVVALCQGALQWAIATFACGQQGRFSAQLAGAGRVFLDGYLIDVEGVVSVLADGQVLLVQDARSKHAFQAHAGRWMLCKNDSIQRAWPVGHIGHDQGFYVVRTGVSNASHGFPWPDQQRGPLPPIADEAAIDAAVRRVEAAHALLASAGGEHLSWVRGGLAGYLLLAGPGLNDARVHGSSAFPGLLALDPPDDPVHCAELIVQETSRQYVAAFLMVAALLREDQEAAFYSPLKRSYETMGRVIIGAHAVGNVLLFQQHLARTHRLDKAAMGRRDMQRIWFESHYMRALDACTNLTEAGRRLWAQLRASVIESGVLSHQG